MSTTHPHSTSIARAPVSPDACPVCHGARVLPSMTVLGLTNPCPRCLHALRPASNPVEKPEQGAPTFAGVDLARPGADRTVYTVDGFLAPEDRRHDAPLHAAQHRGALFLAGAACGVVFALLVVGIFRVFA